MKDSSPPTYQSLHAKANRLVARADKLCKSYRVSPWPEYGRQDQDSASQEELQATQKLAFGKLIKAKIQSKTEPRTPGRPLNEYVNRDNQTQVAQSARAA